MDYAARLGREAERWSPAEKAASLHGNWMQLRAVREHINTCITGHPDMDWGEGVARQFLFGRWHAARGLSLGCSDGGVERTAMASGIFASFEGIDISPAAIEQAQRLAAAHGFHIRYEVADVNFVRLPERAFDLVTVVMALHHFERLEHVLDEVSRTLAPGGLLVFNEFVGPTRFQWTDRQLELANGALALIPEALRRHTNGHVVTGIARPDRDTMARQDPFEAIRSQEIMELVRERFTIVAERPYGGTILHPLLNGLVPNFDEASPEHSRVLASLIELETAQLRAGLPSDFVVVVAEPRR